MNLRQKTFSAVRWTTLAMLGKAGFGSLQIAVLARLLSPADFGLMALVVGVIAFAQVFTDMGVSNAIIHHQKVSQEELSSLFWLNVAGGVLMMAIVMLASSLIASFYDAPLLQNLLIAISFHFLVVSLGQQLRVQAEKELRFSELARIELKAGLAGFLVSVLWALIWPSVVALVAGVLAAGLVTTFLFWRDLSQGWRPMMRIRFSEIKRFVGYGSYTMLTSVLGTFNMQVDVFVGGRFLSAQALGLYSLPRELGFRVANVINPIVTRVGLPVMAKVQDDMMLLKNVYLKTIRMVASVNFPIYLAMAIFAPEVVELFFGEKWADAVPLMRILALWGLFRSITNPVGSLIFAVGRVGLALKWNLVMILVVPFGVWLGAQYGNYGLAFSMLALTIALMIPAWFFLVRPLCGAAFLEYFRQLMSPFIIALISCSLAYAAVRGIEYSTMRLIAGVVVGGMAYAIISRSFNRVWYEAMREMISVAK